MSDLRYVTISYISNVGKASSTERRIPENTTLKDFLDSEFGGNFSFGGDGKSASYLVLASYFKESEGNKIRINREQQTNGDLVLKTGDRITVSPTKVDAGQQ